MNKNMPLLFAALLPITLTLTIVSAQNLINETHLYNTTAQYDPEILVAFESNSEIRVMVKVRDTSGIVVTSEHTREQQNVLDNQRIEFLNNKTDSILFMLNESEFKLRKRFLSGSQFYGDVTKAGFEKLIRNPDVSEVYLPQELSILPVTAINETDNQTLPESSEVEAEPEPAPSPESEPSLFGRIIQFLRALFGFG